MKTGSKAFAGFQVFPDDPRHANPERLFIRMNCPCTSGILKPVFYIFPLATT